MKDSFGKILELAHLIPSIRVKLMVIISAVVLLSLGVLTYITLDIFQADMNGMITLVNSRTTKLLAEKVNTEISARAQNLRLINELKAGGRSFSQDSLLRRTFLKKDSDALYVLAVTGSGRTGAFQPIYRMINDAALRDRGMKAYNITKNIPKLKPLSKHSLRGELIVKNISPLFSRPIWALMVPLSAGRAIWGFYATDALAKVFVPERVRKAKAANALVTSFLVDTAGQVIVHPNKDMVIKSESVAKLPIVEEMHGSASNHGLKRYSYNGVTEMGAFQRVGIANLGVVTTINEHLALEGVRNARERAILISLLIICISILFIYFFATTMTKPLKGLVRAATKIREGDYDQHIDNPSADEIGELTTAFNEMSDGLEEREKLKGAFNKFVNEEIANRVLDGSLKLGGENREVTVFFSDIRSFTPISEGMRPKEVVEFLNQYMTLMVGIIHQTNGVVDKFIGDAIMAVWGAPVSKGNHAVNGVEAAVRMREAMLKFNKGRGTKKKPLIHIGCGINTGEVLAGQIGSEDRLEYTVIGDAVNLGARIEALCKTFGVDILISSGTYAKVKEKFICKPMEKLAVKGKTGKQQIYVVLGRKKDKNVPKSIAELRKLLDVKVKKRGRKTEMVYELVKKR